MKMRTFDNTIYNIAVCAIACAAAPLALLAQGAPPPPATEVGAPALAMTTLAAKATGKLTVSSSAFTNGGAIPFENTQYKGNTFPGLTWTAGPSATKSYAIIMQDGDGVGRDGQPYLHWTLFNIASTTTKLEPGMLAVPAGAQYGPNYKGKNQPYLGPRTPGGPKHRYHLQVFALDASLTLDPLVDYPTLVAALKGHVLASGEVIGLAEQMVTPP